MGPVNFFGRVVTFPVDKLVVPTAKFVNAAVISPVHHGLLEPAAKVGDAVIWKPTVSVAKATNSKLVMPTLKTLGKVAQAGNNSIVKPAWKTSDALVVKPTVGAVKFVAKGTMKVLKPVYDSASKPVKVLVLTPLTFVATKVVYQGLMVCVFKPAVAVQRTIFKATAATAKTTHRTAVATAKVAHRGVVLPVAGAVGTTAGAFAKSVDFMLLKPANKLLVQPAYNFILKPANALVLQPVRKIVVTPIAAVMAMLPSGSKEEEPAPPESTASAPKESTPPRTPAAAKPAPPKSNLKPTPEAKSKPLESPRPTMGEMFRQSFRRRDEEVAQTGVATVQVVDCKSIVKLAPEDKIAPYLELSVDTGAAVKTSQRKKVADDMSVIFNEKLVFKNTSTASTLNITLKDKNKEDAVLGIGKLVLKKTVGTTATGPYIVKLSKTIMRTTAVVTVNVEWKI